MRPWLVRVWTVGSVSAAVVSMASAAESPRVPLDSGWAVQSSAVVAASGDAVSRPGFSAAGWYAATVPGTIVGALVQDGQFPDLFVGTNLRQLPGVTYPIGAQFSNLPMSADSPYKVSWWYRKELELPSSTANHTIWLNFNGINYRANVWV